MSTRPERMRLLTPDEIRTIVIRRDASGVSFKRIAEDYQGVSVEAIRIAYQERKVQDLRRQVIERS